MVQAIVTVLVLIVVVIYAVFFAFWNQGVVEVVGFQFGTQAWVEKTMPVAFLPLLGLVVGAAVMALSLWGPWLAAKRAVNTVRAQVQAEKQKSNERAKRVNSLLKQVKELKAELAAAKGQGRGETGPDQA